MFGSNDILQTIIRQSVKGFNNWQIEPLWVSVEKNKKEVNRPEILPEVAQVGSQNFQEVYKTIELNNDILILTNKELDIPINATLTIESHDNLFTITKAEYAVITFHKYQVFSNYLKITLKDYGNYIPFQLEFLQIKPSLTSGFNKIPFSNAFGYFFNEQGNRNCNNLKRNNND